MFERQTNSDETLKKMTTTTSIKKLIEEGLLYESDSKNFVTNEEVINAAAILAYRNGVRTEEELYDVIYTECDMSMVAALNNMDMEELLQYAEIHS